MKNKTITMLTYFSVFVGVLFSYLLPGCFVACIMFICKSVVTYKTVIVYSIIWFVCVIGICVFSLAAKKEDEKIYIYKTNTTKNKINLNDEGGGDKLIA